MFSTLDILLFPVIALDPLVTPSSHLIDSHWWHLIITYDTWFSLMTLDSHWWHLILTYDSWYSQLWHLILTYDAWFTLMTLDSHVWHLIPTYDTWFLPMTLDSHLWHLILTYRRTWISLVTLESHLYGNPQVYNEKIQYTFSSYCCVFKERIRSVIVFFMALRIFENFVCKFIIFNMWIWASRWV